MKIKNIEDYYDLREELSKEFNLLENDMEYMIDVLDKLYNRKLLNAICRNSILVGHFIRIILDILKIDYVLDIKMIEFHIPSPNEVYIPGTKYYLNINEGIKNILLFLFTYWITKEYNLAILVDIFNNILKPSISKIQDFEYCVLATIISQSKFEKEFSVENITDYMSEFLFDECNNCSDLWNCPYCKSNVCSISKSDIVKAIDSLKSKNVISLSDNGNYVLNK